MKIRRPMSLHHPVGAVWGCVDGGNTFICCSVLQCVAVGCSELNCAAERFFVCHVSTIKHMCVCVCVCV